MVNFFDYILFVPLLPLIGFLINGLFGNQLPKLVVGLIACITVAISFIISLGIFLQLNAEEVLYTSFFRWINVGFLNIDFSFTVDALTAVFLLIITGVGSLIHMYSASYMHHDSGYPRYFAYLNLFVFFMLLLVLGSSLPIMFIGWEGVGLSSFLLIGFWFNKADYNQAARKAFVMNRIGDLGFLIGIFLIFNTLGTLTFSEMNENAASYSGALGIFTVITLLLFVGATGKSAQIPLYTWLPDAMAGPTPVSALIHAATMVTAGIYMIARMSYIFALAPFTMEVIAIIGAATAILAALIALTQTDIKKVLAYSTVSQLGYMFLALGVGAFTGAVFHVMTHAFFKALLFLGAGSVIHSVHHEQDMRFMGGLKSKMPINFFTMLIATLAISGIPPFSGFFSKDEILAHAFAHNQVLWGIGVLGAVLTSFYMFRMLYLTFFGNYRGHAEPHESPWLMTVPLMVLAVLSFAGGFVGVPEVLGGHHALNAWLSPVFAQANTVLGHSMHLSHETEWILMGTSVGLVLISILIATRKYVSKGELPAANDAELSGVNKLSYAKFYVDEAYNAIIQHPLNKLSTWFYTVTEQKWIDGIVNGFARVTFWSSKNLRLMQAGNIGIYFFIMIVGIVMIMLFNFLWIN
jgi:NADH-quinone oxidoreductase subunit L